MVTTTFVLPRYLWLEMMFSAFGPGHYSFSARFLALFLLPNQLEVKDRDLVEGHMEGSRSQILA